MNFVHLLSKFIYRKPPPQHQVTDDESGVYKRIYTNTRAWSTCAIHRVYSYQMLIATLDFGRYPWEVMKTLANVVLLCYLWSSREKKENETQIKYSNILQSSWGPRNPKELLFLLSLFIYLHFISGSNKTANTRIDIMNNKNK